MSEVMHFLKLQNNQNLLLELLPLEVKAQNKYFILPEEKKRKDPKSQLCTIRLMELLDLENKSIETMFGLFLKHNIDLDMQKKKSLKELAFHYTLKESIHSFLKLSLSRKPLKTLNLLLKTFLDNLKI